MENFTDRVRAILSGIPEGKVMTYGQVAALAGNPRGARQVVRILHSSSQAYGLPWHRVINAKGEIGFKEEEAASKQKILLEQEGIQFVGDDKIDLETYRHHPDLF